MGAGTATSDLATPTIFRARKANHYEFADESGLDGEFDSPPSPPRTQESPAFVLKAGLSIADTWDSGHIE